MKISDLKNYTVLPGSTPVTEPQKEKTFGQKIADVAQGVSNFVGAKGITEQFGASLASTLAPKDQKELIEFPTKQEVIGSALQSGANLIPGVGAGGGLLTKVGAGLATGYAMDVGSQLQDKNKTISDALTPGVGTAVGGGIPVAGALVVKPATMILGRLFKGLGSGLSGVATKNIDEIINNPQKALQISKQIEQNGGAKVLEDNAKQIINGVSTIRQQARKAYGEGLDKLSAVDINPPVFRENVQNVLDKYGSYQQNGQRILSNVEFSDPKNIQKASELIDKLHNTQLDGRSLRKLSDDIENSVYKIATSDERLSFNAFVKDLASGVKNAVNSSTDKLQKINKQFSSDMELTDAIQNIFGKVNFKNLPELVKASQKVEGIFAQKGLAPEVTDKFLNRIGVRPSDFKTSESIRQMVSKEAGANAKGLTIGEITQQITSSIITPNMVKKLSIATGLGKEKLIPFLRTLKTPARNVVIQALLQMNQETPNQTPQ